MTRDEILEAIRAELMRVAPDVDAATIGLDANIREEADIDSIDFLNFLGGLHERLNVEIPDADAANLATLRSAADYLMTKVAASTTPE